MSSFKTIKLNLKPIKSLQHNKDTILYGYDFSKKKTMDNIRPTEKHNSYSSGSHYYDNDIYTPQRKVSSNRTRISNDKPKDNTSDYIYTDKNRARSHNKHKINSVFRFVKSNPIACMLLLLLLAGIVAGSFLAGNASSSLISNIDFLFMNNFKFSGSSDILEILFSSIISSSALLFVSIIAGMSMLGVLAVPMMCIIKGMGIGLSASYLFITYGINGFLFNSIIILPGALVSSLALIICSQHCILYSVNLISRGFPLKKPPRYFYTFKGFMSKIYKCFLIAGVSAGIDTLLTFCFSGMFNLK